MKTRKEAINFCLSLTGTYEDYPFNDANWTVMRHKGNNKMFAAIYEHLGCIRINVKCKPELANLQRNSFQSVVPAYHMNKVHWNSVILDGSVPEDEIKSMIYDSYELTKAKVRSRKK